MTTAVADFSGYATKTDLVCADGRTILPDAFKENDQQVVPLVYGHGHDDNQHVLGHVKLENRPDGVYAHGFFNETARGKDAREQVRHGDLKYLSIFANQLVERSKQVLKGNIREVSLVLAGANKDALIDYVNIAHSDGSEMLVAEEAFIFTGLEIEPAREVVQHADTSTDSKTNADMTLQEILDTFDENQERALNFLLAQALTDEGGDVQHSDTGDGVTSTQEGDESTDGTDEGQEGEGDESESTEGADEGQEGEESNSTESGDDDQEGEGDESESAEGSEASAEEGTEGSEEGDESTKDESVEGSESGADSDTTEAGDAVQHSDTNQEDNSMTHNVFDQANNSRGGATHTQTTLAHDDVKQIMRDVVDGNTKLSVVLKHYAEDKGITVGGELKHGIENIDYLFPDAQTLQNSPAYVSRRMEWVDKVLNAVRKQPFARIRTITADITPDEARARGYITGNLKAEEFFALSKRETTPQTVYKKQKLDRDDVLDIANLDVVAWLKAEMKVMMDEEIASAILFGDGRSNGDDDKISEAHIRPIASDAELYVTNVNVNLDDANSSAEEIVDAAMAAREFYKGSGQPTFYTTQAIIAKFKMAKDGNGQRYYKTTADIAAILDVADVVPVETMGRVPDLVGIMVNLADYSIGTDRGGQATMFDDFDLDYNKLRYLLETRVSGALTTPKAAVVFRRVAGAAVLVAPDPVAFDATTGVATVPAKTGVVYKNAAGTTLTAGAQAPVAPGADFYAKASPSGAGYFFADDAHDEWTFTRDEA